MKTKIIILSTYDIYITIPLLNKISNDQRIDLKKVFFFKERNSLIKKLKILFLLNFKEILKLIIFNLNLILKKRNSFAKTILLDVNSNDMINKINQINPDLIVCINCPQILNERTIKNINTPIFNFHPGDLPSFRGVLIPFYLLKYKVKNACMTFHKIDKFIDKGKIIYKNYFPITKNDTILSIYEKMFLSKKSYDFIINSIINYRNTKSEENNEITKYYKYPSIVEILKFRFQNR